MFILKEKKNNRDIAIIIFKGKKLTKLSYNFLHTETFKMLQNQAGLYCVTQHPNSNFKKLTSLGKIYN